MMGNRERMYRRGDAYQPRAEASSRILPKGSWIPTTSAPLARIAFSTSVMKGAVYGAPGLWVQPPHSSPPMLNVIPLIVIPFDARGAPAAAARSLGSSIDLQARFTGLRA